MILGIHLFFLLKTTPPMENRGLPDDSRGINDDLPRLLHDKDILGVVYLGL